MMRISAGSKFTAFGSLVAAILMVGASGCNSQQSLIQKVTFEPSDNLETVRVALVFNPDKVQADLAGGFPIKDYGYLFVNPYASADKPFEVGFDLNTAIVNDQDYVHLAPTTVLPNGVPIGLPYAVVEVKAGHPISNKFDIYAYVDVLHGAWMGTAAMFNFLNDHNFPAGLSINQVFLRNSQGQPGVIASVFGPVLNDDGTMKRSGGISVVANVKQLLSHMQKGEKLELYPEKGVIVSGPAAPEYQGHPRKILKLQDNVIHGLNQN